MFKNFLSRHRKKLLIITVVWVFIFVLTFHYIKAEYYTYKYGKEFTDLYGKQFEVLYSVTGWVEKGEFYKVVEYSETSAKIYYVEVEEQTTYHLFFSRSDKDKDWTLTDWKVIWSKYGSADDFPWPFYFKEQLL